MELNVPANLWEQGLVLPPPKPGGAYEPVRVLGSLAYVAVRFPYRDGQPAYQGRVGRSTAWSACRGILPWPSRPPSPCIRPNCPPQQAGPDHRHP